ncbi:hypothetical protein LWI28_015830 [Acer negundo]|uniref:Ribosome biogenesis regulatory protein n=1 Tax=Acer negundo TaxID=4023 RepID=A0AAD5NZQ7_ACENE|nr:hypothetical protein LWI28_015830 [Acer negundo]
MESEKEYEVDLGNIMACNPSYHFPSLPPSNSREDLVKECLQEGTKLVQAIADQLFNLPSTEDEDYLLLNCLHRQQNYLERSIYQSQSLLQNGNCLPKKKE